MMPVGERPGDDAAWTACDEPRQRSPELAVCQPPGPVAVRGDAIGAVVAPAVVVDPGDETVEAGVGGAAGQDPADSTGLGARAVLKAGEQVPGSGCCPALTMPTENRAIRAVSWVRCRSTWVRCRTDGRFLAMIAVCGQAEAGNGADGSAG